MNKDKCDGLGIDDKCREGRECQPHTTTNNNNNNNDIEHGLA
jgi:hypothetical protein